MSARAALRGSLFGQIMTGAIIGDALDQKREHDIDECKPVAADAAKETYVKTHDKTAAIEAAKQAGLACVYDDRVNLGRSFWIIAAIVVVGLIVLGAITGPN